MKVYTPQTPDQARDGIRRVMDAQRKYLPQFDCEFVSIPDEADLTFAHAAVNAKVQGKPFVSHNHGAYWSEYQWGGQEYATNRQLLQTMQCADAITAPSVWVARALSRGLYCQPEVLYHGVDTDEWQPSAEHGNYVLYNKARQDAVSDYHAMQHLAELMPDVQFITTIGEPTNNVRVVGTQPYEKMKDLVRNAALYLAATRETFGIGTLEALACGVPVVGWRYGGQEEIIEHGNTGFLATLGDFQTLSEYVRHALGIRYILSTNARQDAVEHWQWQDKIERYARLYHEQLLWQSDHPKVSVVIPCHNLARFLPDALLSVLQQTYDNYECIVIDDQSNDHPEQFVNALNNPKFRIIRTPSNLGLSGVRNFGIYQANGQYIKYLDADDMLTPNALAVEVQALEQNPDLHIVYGALDLISEDGKERRSNPFPPQFDWYRQVAHLNCVPTGAMMRRKVIEWSGGWRTRQWRAEDAEFWARVTSYGFRAAKITSDATLLYRLRADSKGSIERRNYPDNDGNWLAHLSWHSADTAAQGEDFIRQFGQSVPSPERVPFGAQGKPPSIQLWNVSHYQEPKVAVIVLQLANSTQDQLIDTLDSIVGQTVTEWQAIVVGTLRAPAGFEYVEGAKDMPDAQSKLRTQTYLTVNAGVLLDSDALAKHLHLDIPVNPQTKGRVALKFRGLQSAQLSTNVNGRRYVGAKGQTIWALEQDVEGLLRSGRWVRVESANGHSTADPRKVVQNV